MTFDIHPRQQLARMYTVQLVTKGTKEDTPKVHTSNRLIILTCDEFIVMDLRSESERARIPLDKAFKRLREEIFNQFDEEIQQLMKNRREGVLRDLLDVIPQNRFAEEINRFLNGEEEINEPEPDNRPKITIRPSRGKTSVQEEVLPQPDPAVREPQRIRIVSNIGTGGPGTDE